MDTEVKKKLDMMLINGEITPEQYKERIEILTSAEGNLSGNYDKIERPVNDQQQVEYKNTNKKKNKSLLFVLLLVFIGIGCLITGVVTFLNKSGSTKYNNTQIAENSTSKAEASNISEVIAVPETPKHKPGEIMINSIGMKLVWIPAGEFMMGSSVSAQELVKENKYSYDFTIEHPRHKVRLSKGFWIGKYEVTQSQYEKVMDYNPSYWKGSNNPAEQVRWPDAMEFCIKLSEKEDGKYILPTEAQWEYSCRAGSTSRYCFGNSESLLIDYAWYNGLGGKITKPVGQKRPNDWGLYDMHGNVSEWCLDWYGQDYYNNTSSVDPTGPTSGTKRVSRGSCYWVSNPRAVRSASRLGIRPRVTSAGTGFRVVLLPD